MEARARDIVGHADSKPFQLFRAEAQPVAQREAGVEARRKILLAHEWTTRALFADALDLCIADVAAVEQGAEQRGRVEVVDVDRLHR